MGVKSTTATAWPSTGPIAWSTFIKYNCVNLREMRREMEIDKKDKSNSPNQNRNLTMSAVSVSALVLVSRLRGVTTMSSCFLLNLSMD